MPRILPVAFVALVLSTSTEAQHQTPVFAVDVDVVYVTATVRTASSTLLNGGMM